MNKTQLFQHDRMNDKFHPQPTTQNSQPSESNSGVVGQLKRMKGAIVLDIGDIERDDTQPRQHFDATELQQLADSLKDDGQLQPITVIKDRTNPKQPRYVIVMGERRWRAAQLAGLATLNCIVEQQRLTPEQKLQRQYVENEIRQGLAPIEKAQTYKTLLGSNQLSIREVAKMLKTSPATVSRTVRLLELPKQWQRELTEGKIDLTLAYKLVTIGDEGERQNVYDAAKTGVPAEEKATTVPMEKTGVSMNGTGSRSTKRKSKTIGSFQAAVDGPRNATNAQFATFLNSWAEALLKDRRGTRKAA